MWNGEYCGAGDKDPLRSGRKPAGRRMQRPTIKNRMGALQAGAGYGAPLVREETCKAWRARC